MLTVSIHNWKSYEWIVEARHVTKMPNTVVVSDEYPCGKVTAIGPVQIEHANGVNETIKDFSNIFVMNENGKTIAKYEGMSPKAA